PGHAVIVVVEVQIGPGAAEARVVAAAARTVDDDVDAFRHVDAALLTHAAGPRTVDAHGVIVPADGQCRTRRAVRVEQRLPKRIDFFDVAVLAATEPPDCTSGAVISVD